MSEDGIKVIDRRMFTEDGKLREEYREELGRPLGESRSDDQSPRESSPPSQPEPPPPQPAPEVGSRPGLDPPPSPELSSELRDVGFKDLVASLAEPVSLFLGDAALPDGEPEEDLERARLHIDLLQVLHDKTQGNLSSDEDAVLAELVYRLRMRYVQKRG